VRRTQLYLDEQLWQLLHARADAEHTSVSELVREAVRQRYLGDREKRMAAMEAFVGIRKHIPPEEDSTEIVRRLRTDDRLERLSKL